MIPYATVRDHLDVEHWKSTDGLTWLELVLLHEEEHRADQGHSHDARARVRGGAR